MFSAAMAEARSGLHAALDRGFTGYCASLALFPQRIDELIDEAFVFRGQAGGIDLAAAVYAEEVVGGDAIDIANPNQDFIGRVSQGRFIRADDAFRKPQTLCQHLLRPALFQTQRFQAFTKVQQIDPSFH